MACPSDLLEHRDPAVIAAFMARWDVTATEAAALFEDVMAWLWVSTRPGSPARVIDPALHIIDEMWHELILHTRSYRELCERHFGRFVDHQPSTGETEFDGSIGGDAQWRFIGRELGAARLLRWYVELPLRHDDRWFRRARRHAAHRYRPSPALLARWHDQRGSRR